MNTDDAMAHLFDTYMMLWMKDMFVEGTEIPLPASGMSREEASAAYDQLKCMYVNKEISILRDPYALGADGIEQLDKIEESA